MYRTCMREITTADEEIKQNLNKQRNNGVDGLEESNVKRYHFSPKLIYRFNDSYYNLTKIFCRYKQSHSEMYMNRQKNQDSYSFGKEKSGGRHQYPVSRFITTVSKSVWCQWRDRHTDEWDRLKNPEVDPHNCVQLISDQVAKWHKHSLSTDGVGAIGRPLAKKWA